MIFSDTNWAEGFKQVNALYYIISMVFQNQELDIFEDVAVGFF